MVNAEMAARPQLAPCSRHNLHQSHGALFRSSSLFATAFDAHDGAYPMSRHSEAPRRLDDECREGMDGQIVWPARSRRALPGMRCAPPTASMLPGSQRCTEPSPEVASL